MRTLVRFRAEKLRLADHLPPLELRLGDAHYMKHRTDGD
ncbi:MAG: hypothetical protein JWP87_1144 [Labilithrix sp.]|nr:hypothetical protein [Labilithrix sp.]